MVAPRTCVRFGAGRMGLTHRPTFCLVLKNLYRRTRRETDLPVSALRCSTTTMVRPRPTLPGRMATAFTKVRAHQALRPHSFAGNFNFGGRRHRGAASILSTPLIRLRQTIGYGAPSMLRVQSKHQLKSSVIGLCCIGARCSSSSVLKVEGDRIFTWGVR